MRKIIGHLFHFFPHHFFISFSRTFFSFPFFLLARCHLLPFFFLICSCSSSAPSLSFLHCFDHWQLPQNQYQHQLKLFGVEIGFGSRDRWELGVGDLSLGKRNGAVIESRSLWAFKDLDVFEQKRKGMRFLRSIIRTSRVNSGLWGKRTVEASRGRQHGSRARTIN